MRATLSVVRLLALLSIASSASASAGSSAAASVPGFLRKSRPGPSRHHGHGFIREVDTVSDVSVAESPEVTHSVMKSLSISGGQGVKQHNAIIGVLGVLGGALCHLVLGTTYCWGNFGPYMPAKLKTFGGLDASLVLPFAFVAQMVTMPLGPYFQKKIGCRATTALGCGIMALGVFLSSYAPNLAVFMFCYSLLFGGGVGLAYTAPMVNGWKWFPDKKGLVSGAVVAGFGSGGFVFNQVGTSIINPEGSNAVGGLYPAEVYEKFPVMLRRLSYIYVLLSAIGCLAIEPPPPAEVPTGAKVPAKPAEGLTVSEALADKRFWIMWFMVVMIGTSGINVANNYKKFGGTVEALQSDQFQSLVGSVAALCNGAGRLFWGNLLDMFNFKGVFSALATIQTIAMAFYTVLSQSKAGFLLGTGILLFCMGGNFAMFPALTNKVFGSREGAKIYGVLFSAFATASIVGAKLTSALLNAFDWEWDQVFKLMAFLSVCALAALPFFEG